MIKETEFQPDIKNLRDTLGVRSYAPIDETTEKKIFWGLLGKEIKTRYTINLSDERRFVRDSIMLYVFNLQLEDEAMGGESIDYRVSGEKIIFDDLATRDFIIRRLVEKGIGNHFVPEEFSNFLDKKPGS